MSVDTVVMVLQLLLGGVGRPASRCSVRRVSRHGRRRRTEPEREAERFAHDAAEASPERDVDDEVCR